MDSCLSQEYECQRKFKLPRPGIELGTEFIQDNNKIKLVLLIMVIVFLRNKFNLPYIIEYHLIGFS